MREIKKGIIKAKKRRNIIVLQDSPQHHGLVKANRFLLLLASSLMVIVFVLGFLLVPSDNMLDDFEANKKLAAEKVAVSVENPVLSAEINRLKGHFVGLISGSIENKLRMLEDSIQKGGVDASLGAVKDLRKDMKVLRAYYSVPVKNKQIKTKSNEEILREVSHLKSLIYLTLSSCGLMLAAICGFWIRKKYRLANSSSTVYREGLAKKD